jgi:hypothetical protein
VDFDPRDFDHPRDEARTDRKGSRDDDSEPAHAPRGSRAGFHHPDRDDDQAVGDGRSRDREDDDSRSLGRGGGGSDTTPAEKVAALPLTGEMKVPDGFPIGVQADSRIVVLYLAPEPWPEAFRTFLRAHAPLLQSVPQWTLRIVLPRRFGHAYDDYHRAVHEELESSLSAALIADLKRYFDCRRNIHATSDPQAGDVFRAGHRRFSTPRFEDLYRRWIKIGDEAFHSPSSVAITEALESGAGRVESFVLRHSYRHLSPLVGQSRSTADDVEKGVEKGAHRGDTRRRHAQPRASTPWGSHARTVVM